MIKVIKAIKAIKISDTSPRVILINVYLSD
jgi:hypothetical protein